MTFNTLVKQVEANIGGGIRISVYKQILNPDGSLASEEPHRITVGPFGDFDQIIAENGAHLRQMGFPAINSDELTFVTAQRDAAHAHPITQEIMRIEAERIAEEMRIEEERSAQAAAEAAERAAAAEAAAEARKEAEAAAFRAAVADEVAKLVEDR